MARDMASALDPENEQTSKNAKSSSSSTSSQRKRRKRATGNNGAADDCFTCASRKTKCDRRRPYCTQCLNLGRNCSGYKTTLTWGVGVASRGKLRGFSLPVSDDQKKDELGDTPQNKPESSPAIDGMLKQQSSGQLHHGAGSVEHGVPENFSNFQPIGDKALQAPDSTIRQDVSPTPFGPRINSPIEPFHPQTGAADSGYRSHLYGEERTLVAAPSLARPISSSTHASYPYSEPVTGPASHVQPNQSIYMPWGHVPESTSGLSSQSEIPFEQQRHGAQDDDDIEQIPYRPVATEQVDSRYGNSRDSWLRARGSTSLVMPMTLTQTIGQTPRLRYLISYYTEVISPVIVAFDSPTNPYRTHILHLARESQTLQHAIAALAASNLRQRKESNIISSPRTLPAQKSSFAYSAMTDNTLQAQFGILGPGSDVKEESFHQRTAIRSLNAQLADPNRRREDSVLATLLILSLFHICDSGVASFRTQFAGVKKLLSLRGTGLGTTSEESRWYTKMFTFLDVLAATTNNREGQLQGIYLDLATTSDDQWPLENLVGCDGRLFKVISRLNHLNVLSQNKPVTDYPITDSSIPFVPSPPAMTRFASQPHDFQYIPDSSSYNSATPMHTDPDSRTEFWKEWRSIRRSLQSWRLDDASTSYTSACPSIPDPRPSSSSPSDPYSPISSTRVAPDNIPDLANISEAFRHSALLYTERLADPHLPSSHPHIQSLVLTCLHYISVVRSDVYLLWPLFVTGTECVFESQRAVIRQRCHSLQQDSGFYNNISCLELLEKIWAKNDEAENSVPYTVDGHDGSDETTSGTSKALVPGGQAFRWRSVMEKEGLDGEYIVV